MGSTYASVTLIGADEGTAVRHIAGPAFIASHDDIVLVFAEADDFGAGSGVELSTLLGCVALSVNVHDSDMLGYEVHQNGERLAAGLIPDPTELFGGEIQDVDVELAAYAPDAAALVAAVGRGDGAAVAAALRGDYDFAEERHSALIEALALPAGAAGWGYRYLRRDAAGYEGPELRSINQ